MLKQNCRTIALVLLMANLAILVLIGVASSKSNPFAATASPSGKAYNTAFQTWSAGDQATAEWLLAQDVQRFPNDQRIAFFQAECTRSRWEIQEAYPLLRNTERLNPKSPEGLCAGDIANIDNNEAVNTNFLNLKKLSGSHPNDIPILWMLAIACRQLERTAQDQTSQAKAIKLGIIAYGKLSAKITGKGPVLVHQTYANMLDDSGDVKDAVKQRFIAVEEEPAPWSCPPLIQDLDTLGRHAEAQKLREKYKMYVQSQ